jgi:DNA invertase Pin-like site-specific DNA recombinase
MTKTLRAALYARVSTTDQTCENQLIELRRYATARGWTTAEYVDTGVSGAKDRRPALDQLIADAKRRQVDVVVCWKLDRFGRSLTHLVNAIQGLTDAGVGFTSIGEGIDTQSATGRLMLGILGSFAEFERERIRERIAAGLARARRQGQKLGRRRQRISPRDLERVTGLSVSEAAKVLHVPPSRVHRERERVFQKPAGAADQIAPETTEGRLPA